MAIKGLGLIIQLFVQQELPKGHFQPHHTTHPNIQMAFAIPIKLMCLSGNSMAPCSAVVPKGPLLFNRKNEVWSVRVSASEQAYQSLQTDGVGWGGRGSSSPLNCSFPIQISSIVSFVKLIGHVRFTLFPLSVEIIFSSDMIIPSRDRMSLSCVTCVLLSCIWGIFPTLEISLLRKSFDDGPKIGDIPHEKRSPVQNWSIRV